ncbi:MAG: hypothetical protein ACFFHD_09115 [Promethearchaeota archaeon]
MQLYNISEKGELVALDKLNFEENDVYLVDDEERNTIYIWVGLKVVQDKKDITADIARKIDKERGGSAKILIMKQKREYGSFLTMMHDLRRGRIPGKTIERRPELILKKPSEHVQPSVIKETQKDEKDVQSFIPIESVKDSKHLSEIKIESEARIEKWLKQLKKYRSIKPEKLHEEEKEQEELEKLVVPEITEEPEEFKEFDLKSQIKEAAYYFSLKGYTYDELCWLLAERIQKANLEMPSIEDIKKKAEQVFNSGCNYDELCWLISEMDILTRESLLEEKKRQMFRY